MNSNNIFSAAEDGDDTVASQQPAEGEAEEQSTDESALARAASGAGDDSDLEDEEAQAGAEDAADDVESAEKAAQELEDDAVNAALYPDTAYAHESGGDPRAIPALTYEHFLDTHARHYNPSTKSTHTDWWCEAK